MRERVTTPPDEGERLITRLLLPAPLLFALLFSVTWLLHAALLRLPYFWDEAGYFVPAARDLLLTGDPIPTSTLSNAHPPLVMAWLAFWWKFSAYTPAVTRTAMLLVSAFTLLGVFRVARQVSNAQVAAASTLLAALYPVFFAQSSLAHLDMTAAGFTLWGLSSYVGRHRWRATGWFALAGLAKETALLAPVALVAWELLGSLVVRRAVTAHPSSFFRNGREGLAKMAVLLFSVLPLVGWLAYHYARTGVVFGNPEYFRYNLGATLHPLRMALAWAQRLWQLFGYLNMFVLTGAAALAMRYPPLPAGAGARSPSRAEDAVRPRIAPAVQFDFAIVALAYVLALSIAGGAVLARYLLPVYPLVIIVCVATLWRRVSWWKVAVGVVALAFVVGLFVYPPYRFAPEDNLAYADYVWLHRRAGVRLARLPGARVLTAWPASDELRKPYLGYVAHAVEAVPIENFTSAQLNDAGRRLHGRFNYALIFSTKYEPPHQLRGWWEQVQTRFFDYHRDAPPQVAAGILGGRIVYQEQRGGEWAAIIAVAASPETPAEVPQPIAAQRR